MDDGKYIMTLDNVDQEVFVSTLLEGQYPCKDTRQFVCIPCHFPIPLDDWALKNAAFRPAAQQKRAIDEGDSPTPKDSSTLSLEILAKGIY